MEAETQLQIAENLEFLEAETKPKLMESCAEAGRVLSGLLAETPKQTGS